MNKNLRKIAVLILAAMIFSILPLPILANEYEAAGTEARECLDMLCDESTGELYSGISFPDGVRVVDNEMSAIGPEGDVFLWCDSADGDGSKILADTSKTLDELSVGSSGEVSFYYTTAHVLERGAPDTRYVVSSVCLMAGESLEGDFIEICFSGKSALNGGEDETVRLPVFAYDKDTGSVLLRSGSYDGGEEDVAVSHFSTAVYTDFTLVLDIEEDKAYYYINGIEVGVKSGFSGMNGKFSLYEYNLFFRLSENSPVFGVFLKSGKVKSYTTDDAAKVFDGDGNFIFENRNPANGVFKIGESCFFFDKGLMKNSSEVFAGEYYLELEKSSGRIVNCYRKTRKDFDPAAKDELEELAGEGIISGLETGLLGSVYKDSSYTSEGNEKTISAYVKSGSSVTPCEINAIKSYTYEEGKSFTVGFKNYVGESYSPTTYYKSEAASSADKVTLKTASKRLDYVYANPKAALKKDFVLTFDVRFGEGVGSISQNGEQDLSAEISMPFFYVNIDSGDGSKSDAPFGKIVSKGGTARLFFGDVDCGECSTEEFTRLAVFADFSGGMLTAYIYVNGELKGSTRILGSVYSIDYFSISAVAKYAWSGNLLTVLPATVYNASSYLDCTTDGYTGFADNGGKLVWYKDGAVEKSADAAEVEAYAGRKYAELCEYGVSLSESLSLSFRIRLATLAIEDGAYALLKFAGMEKKLALNTLSPSEDGLYSLRAELPARLVGEDVSIEIFENDGTRVEILKNNFAAERWSYSIKSYAEFIINNADAYGEEASEVSKSILLYGAFAERYFSGSASLRTAECLTNAERLALTYGSVGRVLEDARLEEDRLFYSLNDKSSELNFTASADDPSRLGRVYLKLESVLTLRIELNTDTAPTEISGATLYTDESGANTKYYLDIEGITPTGIGNVHSITLDGALIMISPLAAARAVLNAPEGAYSEDICNLMRAVYLYYLRAAEYTEAEKEQV